MAHFFRRIGLPGWVHNDEHIIDFCYAACFATTRDVITRHPISVYQNITKMAVGDASQGYVIERSWYTLFHRVKLPEAVSATVPATASTSAPATVSVDVASASTTAPAPTTALAQAPTSVSAAASVVAVAVSASAPAPAPATASVDVAPASAPKNVQPVESALDETMVDAAPLTGDENVDVKAAGDSVRADILDMLADVPIFAGEATLMDTADETKIRKRRRANK
jgi:hypothetical protein